jgi:spore coat polysaccharide biosynthesis predicted glycosyltransferase SpsG
VNKRFLFRCDADQKNGFGHFSRCLNLARGIKTKDPDADLFFFGNFNKFAANLLEIYKISQISIPSSLNNDYTYQLNIANEYDYFILDSYLIDQDYIDCFSNQIFKFVKIDDFNNLNLREVDLTVNFCFRAHEFSYLSKKVCLGVSYFPVREELKSIRIKNEAHLNQSIQKVVIFIGGTDHYNVGEKIMISLNEVFSNIQINLISSQPSNNDFDTSRNVISYLPVIPEIETYLADTDVVITGGGLTKYECAYCCIPNASLTQTAEVYAEAQSFAQAGLTYDLGMAVDVDKNKLINDINKLSSFSLRKTMVARCHEEFIINSTQNFVNSIIQA